MENLNPKALKAEAVRRLGGAGFNPKYLVLLNTGVVVGMGLLANGLNFLLSHQIGSTGGLSGLGTRSVLQTMQTLISYASSLFTPFWMAGLLFCFIGIVRGQNIQPRDMLAGFRRFPKLLSFSLFMVIGMSLLMIPVLYGSTFLYMMTPLSAPFTAAVEELMESGAIAATNGMIDISLIPPDVLLKGIAPIFLAMAAVGIPVFMWYSYSLDLGPYLIMTDSVRGGFAAFMTSFRMTRGYRMKLLKLDLSYWYYYVLEILAAVVLYLDLIFPLLGLESPINSTAFYFVLLIAYGIIEMGLHYWKKAEHDTAFVLAYEQITHPESAPEPADLMQP